MKLVSQLTRNIRCSIYGCHNRAVFTIGYRSENAPKPEFIHVCEDCLKQITEEGIKLINAEPEEKPEEKPVMAAEPEVEVPEPKEDVYVCPDCGETFAKPDEKMKYLAHRNKHKKENK